MHQSHSWEANRFSAIQIPAFNGTLSLFIGFKTARRLSLSWARSIQSTPTSYFLKICFSIFLPALTCKNLKSQYILVFDRLTSLELPFSDVLEYVNGRNNLRKLGIDRRLTLKLIFKDYGVRVCVDSSGSEERWMTDCLRCGEFLTSWANTNFSKTAKGPCRGISKAAKLTGDNWKVNFSGSGVSVDITETWVLL